jgi:hypothetical protein
VKEQFVIEQIRFEQNGLSPENGKGSAERRKCTFVLVGVQNETLYDAYNVAVLYLHRMDDQYDSNCTSIMSL